MMDGQSGLCGEDSALISCQSDSLALGLKNLISVAENSRHPCPTLSNIAFMRPLQSSCCRERICTSLQGVGWLYGQNLG